MHRFALLFALALAGCTPPEATSTPSTSPTPATMRETSTGYEIITADNSHAAVHRVAASLQRVWTDLPEVHAELGISVEVMNSGSQEIGNRRFVVRRMFAGNPLSTFLDCGTVVGVLIANTYRIEMSVLTSLRPSTSGGTELHTRVEGKAFDPGSSGGAVPCRTTGRLEQRIAGTVRERTGT